MRTFDSIHSGLAETRGVRIPSSEIDYDALEIERAPPGRTGAELTGDESGGV